LKRHPEVFQYTSKHGWHVKSLLPLAAVGFDVPIDAQINFQNPATLVMDGIIDLHHDIMGFLIMIMAVVTYMMFAALYNYREAAGGKREFGKHGEVTRHVNHHASLEVIWTVIPALILIAIALPSFALLYAMDDVGTPVLTVKVVGHQ
jgi:cytochrome c oxidase subunit 2